MFQLHMNRPSSFTQSFILFHTTKKNAANSNFTFYSAQTSEIITYLILHVSSVNTARKMHVIVSRNP